jgi:hypothetical protein
VAFTYEADLAASQKDQVRFLVGDTDPGEFFLHDDEINWILSQWVSKGSVYYAASMAAESIAARFAREVTTNSDSQTVSTSELQQKYLDLAARLMRQHETLLTGGVVDMGGVNAGEQPDPTVTSPAFGTAMHDFVEAGVQDNGDGNSWNYDQAWWDGVKR